MTGRLCPRILGHGMAAHAPHTEENRTRTMEYTIVTELYARNEVSVWLITRDEDKHLEAAFPFDTVGDAIACIAHGTLGQMMDCRDVFLDALGNPRCAFPGEDMDMEHETVEGHFPALNWLPLH